MNYLSSMLPFNSTAVFESVSNFGQAAKSMATASLSIAQNVSSTINRTSEAIDYVKTHALSLGMVTGSALTLVGGAYAIRKLALAKESKGKDLSDVEGGLILAAAATPLAYTGSLVHPLLSTAAAVVATGSLAIAGNGVIRKVVDFQADDDSRKIGLAVAAQVASCVPLAYTLGGFSLVASASVVGVGYVAARALHHSNLNHSISKHLIKRWDIDVFMAEKIGETTQKVLSVGALALSVIPAIYQAVR